MPTYCYECGNCHARTQVVRPMKDSSLSEICECGRDMDRDYITEQCAVRGDYNDPIVSESLAFDAIDLTEHRRRFPDIEVQVDHARSARPIFKNLNQKRRYLKARGFVDCNSFV